jgi:hypothetical protein
MRSIYWPLPPCLLWVGLVGCERKSESSKVEPPVEVRPDSVFKTDDDAKTIINTALKSHGGEQVFTRWNCGYLKYKTAGGVVPAQLGEVTVEDTFQLPGHFKRVTRMDGTGKELLTVFVVNHGKGWTKIGDTSAEPSDNNFTEKAEHPFAGFCNLTPLTDPKIRLTKLGMEKVNGTDAMGIRVQSEIIGDVEFYFGAQTGLLLKSRKTLPGGNPAMPNVFDSYLDDYKDVQGAKVPMRIKGVQNGKTVLDVTIIEARFADKFDEGTFAKP